MPYKSDMRKIVKCDCWCLSFQAPHPVQLQTPQAPPSKTSRYPHPLCNRCINQLQLPSWLPKEGKLNSRKRSNSSHLRSSSHSSLLQPHSPKRLLLFLVDLNLSQAARRKSHSLMLVLRQHPSSIRVQRQRYNRARPHLSGRQAGCRRSQNQRYSWTLWS